ncbi:MAG: aldo/keto reductase [Planctomycetaceae bacterium]
MRTRPLGRTGLDVTRLGYGSMGLRGPATWGVRTVSEADAERFLNTVLDAGTNFIDTAPDYGCCEERIGKYIAHRRDEFFLATKCGCCPIQHPDHLEVRHQWTRDVVRRNIEQSLTRMRTDHLDLVQFHGGDALTLMREGLIDLLLDYKRQGVVRHVGVSSSLPHLPGMIELGVFETFQIPYSCLAPEHHDWITRAAQTGAGIIIRGGIAHGGPDAEIQRDQLNAVWNATNLDELRTDDMSRAELILRFTLSHPAVDTVIVGTCNEQHLRENLAAAERGPLPKSVVDQIGTRVLGNR